MTIPLRKHNGSTPGAQQSTSLSQRNGAFDETDPAARQDRVREAGLGYGRSSGYGTRLHFEDGHVDAMFRSHW